MSVLIADIVAALEEAFPSHWAEHWDNIGLLAGDPERKVTGVLISLDPTPQTLASAMDSGANALVTHHPAFLSPPARITSHDGGVAFSAIDAGIALITAHTNLDRAPSAAEALPRILGLEPGVPLEDALMNIFLMTVYVPSDEEREVAAAMTAAGAGRIGDYRGCSFVTAGVGSFTPAADATPHTGTPGEPSTAPESRLEMVAPPDRVAAAVSAARSAHPYEEPLITLSELRIARGAARMGRLSALPAPTTLARFVDEVVTAFGITPKVWGAPDTPVDTVATVTGSASSLVPAAVRAAASVLLAGEVRYHDARTAVAEGLAVIEIGHDISEWPLVPLLAEAVSRTPGLDPGLVSTDSPVTDWWTPREGA